MSKTLLGLFLGAVVVWGLGLLTYRLFQGGKETARAAAKEIADDVGEHVESRIKEGIKDGVREGVQEGVDEAQRQTIQAPAEIFGEIAGIFTPDQKDQITGTFSDVFEELNPAKIKTPVDAVGAIFGASRKLGKQADDVLQDILGISDEQEIDIGKKLRRITLQQLKTYDSAADRDRIDRVVAPLLQVRERQGIPITFTLVDNPEINAMAMPGGYIYVHRGLMEFVRSDAELQFVLGHELGHIDLKHCIRGFTYSYRISQQAGELGEAVVGQFYRNYELQFSEDLELAADAYAYRRMRGLNRSQSEILQFPRRMMSYLETQGVPVDEPHPATLPEAVEVEIHNHFRTHPPTLVRLKQLEALD